MNPWSSSARLTWPCPAPRIQPIRSEIEFGAQVEGGQMDEEASHEPPATTPDTPGAWLDMLRKHPEWPERERDLWLTRLVARFQVDDLVPAVPVRLAGPFRSASPGIL